MGRFEACINCPDRTVGCHATCPKYLKDKAESTKEYERIQQIKKAEREIVSYECRIVEKAKRRNQ